ncbi:unnamed protein product [Rotaria sordida]|uniref:Uncharacterized protein n=4 Tax=Rotaria TaxID=231623 RepID=A0A815LKX3_9BILA|nr:unnamed protein product [Rotaria sordida]CAF4131636.1 unnamed protein product [Rotaria sordida]
MDGNECMNTMDIDNITTIKKEDEKDQIVIISNTDKNTTRRPTSLKKSEEQVLSQKLTQLSITTNNQQSTAMEDIADEIKQIPDYLSKRNESFIQMINQVISITANLATTNKTKKELRQIAILIYKIMVIQISNSLWTTYLKSGMGQLIIQSKEQVNCLTNLHIWPKEIKSIIIQKSIKMNTTNENEIYMNFIGNKLH